MQVEKNLRFEKAVHSVETPWPTINWSIISTLKDYIQKLPAFDMTLNVSTVSVEAFKAGANSVFNCYRCRKIVRGCNLVRCDTGHLLCENCLSGLLSKHEGGCVYYRCSCGGRLADAYGDNNEAIKKVWGHGIQRRMGRQKALKREDFLRSHEQGHLDCA